MRYAESRGLDTLYDKYRVYPHTVIWSKPLRQPDSELAIQDWLETTTSWMADAHKLQDLFEQMQAEFGEFRFQIQSRKWLLVSKTEWRARIHFKDRTDALMFKLTYQI